jgi:hypothetical protein
LQQNLSHGTKMEETICTYCCQTNVAPLADNQRSHTEAEKRTIVVVFLVTGV